MTAQDPDLTFTTAYEPTVAAGDGASRSTRYVASHTPIAAHRAGKDAELTGLPGRAMQVVVRND